MERLNKNHNTSNDLGVVFGDLSVVETLRKAIAEGKYDPPVRLVEAELCDELQVSRGTVREALNQLKAEGLIQYVPYKGFTVPILTVHEAENIYQAREVLEGLASRLFTEKATKDEKAELEAAIISFEEAGRSGTKEDLLEAKNHVYDVLVAGSRNEVIRNLLMSLRDRIAWLRIKTLSHPGRPDLTAQELREILNAINKGDAQGAERAAILHVREAAKVAYSRLEKTEYR